MKPVFSYQDHITKFVLYRRGEELAAFKSLSVTNHFMRWLVDLLNRNHAEFVKDRTEQTIREMGF